MPSRRTPRGNEAPATADLHETHVLTEAITQLRRALRASIRTDIPWEALPMAQVEVLQTLAESASSRISDVAERLHLANSTVSGLVAQMIHSGLVNRGTDPDDRRAAVVTLTAAGQSQLSAWERAHEERIGAALDQLDQRDRLAIGRALGALGRLAGRLSDA